MSLADRLLLIHMDTVTHAAPRRRRSHKYGLSLTFTLLLCAVALAVFGHSSL